MLPNTLRVTGQGPRVLLIQGTGVAGQAWAPQIQALSDAYELAWYDAPGIGERPGTPGTVADMAADALSMLDALEWPTAFVAGHSLGGVVAQQLALDAPDRVQGLLLLCTFAQGRAALSLAPGTVWIQTRTAIGTAAMRRRAFYELVRHPDLPIDEPHIEAIEHAFGRRLDALPPAATAQVWALVNTNLSGRLGEVQCPAYVLSGQHDRVAPPAQGRRLAAALDCDLDLVDGGHALPIQQADVVNHHLRTRLDLWTAPGDR